MVYFLFLQFFYRYNVVFPDEIIVIVPYCRLFVRLLHGYLLILLISVNLLSAENELWKFFKYSTAYASFSLNAPRHQDDRFAIIGGLSTGQLQVGRTERELKPDFQTSFLLFLGSFVLLESFLCEFRCFRGRGRNQSFVSRKR